MANRSTQEVEIKLDRTRKLRLDFNAVAEFEGVTGRSFLSYFVGQKEGEVLDRLGFREVRAMLWAGLQHEDPGLTLQATGNLIAEYAEGDTMFAKMQLAYSKVFEAFVLMCGPDAKKKLEEMHATP